MNWNREAALEMIAAKIPLAKVATVFGVTADTVKRRIDPSYARSRQERVNELRVQRQLGKAPEAKIIGARAVYRTTDAQARRLMDQIPYDTRDLTARVFGDPLPGRSALDKQGEGMR